METLSNDDLKLWYDLPETKKIKRIANDMVDELKEKLIGEFERDSERDFIRGMIHGIRWVFEIEGE